MPDDNHQDNGDSHFSLPKREADDLSWQVRDPTQKRSGFQSAPPRKKSSMLPAAIGVLCLTVLLLVAAIFGLLSKTKKEQSQKLIRTKAKVEWESGQAAKEQFAKELPKAKTSSVEELRTFAKDFSRLEEQRHDLRTGREATLIKKQQDILWRRFLENKTTLAFTIEMDTFLKADVEEAGKRSTLVVTKDESEFADGGVQVNEVAFFFRMNRQALLKKFMQGKVSEMGRSSPVKITLLFSPYHVEPIFSERSVRSVELPSSRFGSMRSMNTWVTLRRILLKIHCDLIGAATLDKKGNVLQATVKGYRLRQ